MKKPTKAKCMARARQLAKERDEEFVVYWDWSGLSRQGPYAWDIMPLREYHDDVYGIREQDVAFITPDEHFQMKQRWN